MQFIVSSYIRAVAPTAVIMALAYVIVCSHGNESVTTDSMLIIMMTRMIVNCTHLYWHMTYDKRTSCMILNFKLKQDQLLSIPARCMGITSIRDFNRRTLVSAAFNGLEKRNLAVSAQDTFILDAKRSRRMQAEIKIKLFVSK